MTQVQISPDRAMSWRSRPLTARMATLLVLGAALAVSACGLPRSGPTRGEIFAGSVEKGGSTHIVSVDDRVNRAASYSPAYGFGSDFRNAGEVGADVVRPGDVLALWASTRGYTLPVDFSNLLEDAGDWLMVPRIAAAPLLHTSRAYDDLGPHTGKWDYLAADGSLLACVYRHDTPSGKQYRPWDV